ncbi:MAG TPA: tetratricopeptide repeat protein [Burkholderiales bacterium]|nr:tetratricopeptide repeat protein [Burkholderiales bacterium]
MSRVWRAAAILLIALAATRAHAADKEPQCGGTTASPEAHIKACTRLIEFGSLTRPDLAKAYYARGTEWANQGNHDRAIADFTVAVELEPKFASAYYNRALSRSEKGDADLAIADYDTALQLAPKDWKAHVGRAVEWTVKGEYKHALADYEAVIRLEPQTLTGYFGRGRVRFYVGEFTSAASDFARAYQIEPGMYTALWLFLARKRADIAGEKTLAQEAGTTGTGRWPAPVIGLFLGVNNPEAVQKAATDLNVRRQRDQRCEANFYIAQWHILRGARDAAAPLLNDARASCPSSFIEHEGAVAELRRLDSQRPR